MSISCYLLIWLIGLTDPKDLVLAGFCVAAALLSIWGYILSSLDCLGVLSAWFGISLFTVFTLGLIAYIRKPQLNFFQLRPLGRQVLKVWFLQTFGTQPIFVKICLFTLMFFTFSSGIINFLLVIKVAPHNWDSMTAHLPRMAQYFQHSNLDYFDSDNWAQIIHPKGAALLFLYLFIAFGHNENATQLAQYVSYWVVVFSIYGISRKMNLSRPQSVFAALISSLLVAGLVQASTNLNDMIMTAYFGSVVYFLFVFRETGRYKFLALAALGVGLAFGTKASSLSVLPALSLICLMATWVNENFRKWIKDFLIFQGAVILAVCVFALPSGYVDNFRLFGNFLGNQDVRDIHSFAGKSVENILQGGFYNTLRYGVDFLAFDGLPPVKQVLQAQHLLRFLPLKILSWMGINLEDPVAINFFPFENNRLPGTSEARSYWGIFGFGLVWIVVAASLFKAQKHPERFFMALAAVVFLISVAYSGPYDSSRGRYFSICAVFAVPLTGIFLDVRKRYARLYLIIVILIGGVSALSAVLIKTTPLSSNYPERVDSNILSLNRIGQLTFNNYNYYRPLVSFEELVPENATVAIYLYPNTFEYPLYGKYLTREIISINSFYKGLLPVPSEAQYLLYARGYPCALPGDSHLGADWFLRKLSSENRKCAAAIPQP